MPKILPTSVRLTADLVKRLDVLAREIESVPRYSALGRPGFSKALRIAIGLGVEALEADVRGTRQGGSR